MNATVHYMTGTPPTREDLMREYGVEEGVYGLYSDETYANAVERHKTENTSLTTSPVEMLQLSETQLFDSTKEDTQKSVKIEAHTHSLSIDEKAPTCTEDGYYRVTCSVCGEVLADHVCKRRGHNMYMVDPEDNTANIICPVFKCNRCDYTESTDHTHNWIAKGYENMTYPDGGDSSVLHAGQSIDDMAMRVVKEGKQAVSSFYNAESLIGNLQDAVYFEAENITNWITSDRIDFKKPIDKFAAAHS